MGRAIDMENDISVLKTQLKKLEDTVRGMVSKLDSLDEKSSKTKHIDLTEVKDETEKEKTNDEGDGKSSKSAHTAKPKSSKKSK